jgi:hypothetical protein
LAPGLNTKRLDILKDTVPKLASGLLYGSGSAVAGRSSIERTQTCGADAEGKIGRDRDTLRREIVELANTHKLPAIYYQKEFVDDGGLMAYAAVTLTCTAAPLSEGVTLPFNYRRRAMVAAVAC